MRPDATTPLLATALPTQQLRHLASPKRLQAAARQQEAEVQTSTMGVGGAKKAGGPWEMAEDALGKKDITNKEVVKGASVRFEDSRAASSHTHKAHTVVGDGWQHRRIVEDEGNE